MISHKGCYLDVTIFAPRCGKGFVRVTFLRTRMTSCFSKVTILSKESFIVDAVVHLIWRKSWGEKLGDKHGGSLSLGELSEKMWNQATEYWHRVKVDYGVSRKTMWQALKTLESEGYLTLKGKDWCLGEKLNDLTFAIPDLPPDVCFWNYLPKALKTERKPERV
jgi:hypothetical protein